MSASVSSSSSSSLLAHLLHVVVLVLLAPLAALAASCNLVCASLQVSHICQSNVFLSSSGQTWAGPCVLWTDAHHLLLFVPALALCSCSGTQINCASFRPWPVQFFSLSSFALCLSLASNSCNYFKDVKV